MINGATFLPTVDKIAVSASIVCAVHCLCLPILVVVSPAIGATIFGQESFHQILVFLIIPISVVGLFMGCRKHKNRLVMLMGFGGLMTLGLAASLGHSMLGERGETLLTLVGSFVIAGSHVRNYILCRRVDSC